MDETTMSLSFEIPMENGQDIKVFAELNRYSYKHRCLEFNYHLRDEQGNTIDKGYYYASNIEKDELVKELSNIAANAQLV